MTRQPSTIYPEPTTIIPIQLPKIEHPTPSICLHKPLNKKEQLLPKDQLLKKKIARKCAARID